MFLVVFYDTNIGLIHIECEQSTGQAGEALEGYLQRYGNPMKYSMTMPKNSFMATSRQYAKQKGLDRKHLLPIHPTKTQRKNTWRYSHLALDLSSTRLAYPTNSSGNMPFFIAYTYRIEWLYPVDAPYTNLPPETTQSILSSDFRV